MGNELRRRDRSRNLLANKQHLNIGKLLFVSNLVRELTTQDLETIPVKSDFFSSQRNGRVGFEEKGRVYHLPVIFPEDQLNGCYVRFLCAHSDEYTTHGMFANITCYSLSRHVWHTAGILLYLFD
jgi:hypothetical protein